MFHQKSFGVNFTNVLKTALDNFHPIFFFPVCIENIFWDNSKYFEMSLQFFEEKNIFLSKCLAFYRNIAIL